MTSASHISIEKLHKDVHQALRIWDQDSSKESPLSDLGLYHKFRRQGHNIRKATNKVIFEGLAVLEKDNPPQNDLLRKRFIDGKTVFEVANHLNQSQSHIHYRQKKAIRHLAQKLKEMEETAIKPRQEALNKRLEYPTYSNLIGVEEHLSTLRQVLMEAKRPWIVSIEGIGGIGKTSLADALLREIISQGLFDNFGWVSARQETLRSGGGIKRTLKPALTVDGLVEELVKQLLGFTPAQLSGKQAFEALRYCLKERPHLIVIDNLRTLLDVESLLPILGRLANPSKFLLTSRESLYKVPGVYHFVVPPLTVSDGLRLVREEAIDRNLLHLVEAHDQELQPIYETVGGNPLALRLVVGQTHMDHLDVILDDLKAARGEKAEDLYSYIYRRAWDNLNEVTRKAFMFMPLALDQGSELEFLQIATGLDYRDLRRALNLLVTLNLVDFRGHKFRERRYTIHNLTRTFLQKQVIKWQ